MQPPDGDASDNPPDPVDPRAHDVLVTRHLPQVRAFVRLQMGRAMREWEESCDVVQSACREVLKDLAAGTFRPKDDAAFRHWFFETAARKVKDHHKYLHRDRRDVRRLQRVASRSDASRPSQLAAGYRSLLTPSKDAIAHETAAKLEAAFDRLDERDRLVILRSRFQAVSHEEIGKELGCSTAYARTLLARALAKLSKLLADGRSPDGE